MTTESQMSSSAVLELLDQLDRANIRVWLDGGWGVDALLGRQTRAHHDVDIIVSVADVPRLREILGQRGFAIREGSPPYAFVLADRSGVEVDADDALINVRRGSAQSRGQSPHVGYS